MSPQEFLQITEKNTPKNSHFYHPILNYKSPRSRFRFFKPFYASFFLLCLIIVLFFYFFSFGNFIPDTIHDRLIEATDIQYPNAVKMKKVVFKHALVNGNIPDDVAKFFKSKGVLIGYFNENNQFIENHKSGKNSVLKQGDIIITSDNFLQTIDKNIPLLSIFNNATYKRADYYFDESAQYVFKNLLHTSRDNYNSHTDLKQGISSVMQDQSDINTNTVYQTSTTRQNPQTKKTETVYNYFTNGKNVNSKTNATSFIEEIRLKNPSNSPSKSTLITADILKTADTISKEQRSSVFFATFMENISKMKYGKGNETPINEAMNYLYHTTSNQITDINTGKLIEVTGSPIESPSLYSILTKTPISPKTVENYSSDRILKTTKNQLSHVNTNLDALSQSIISETIASVTSRVKATIGRFLSSGTEFAISSALSPLIPTISHSLIENSFNSIHGIPAGEFLVEGAVNLSKQLAVFGSGATPGDTSAIISYQKATQEILALDATVDRLNKSPFDISSKHTFFGSLFYQFTFNFHSTSLFKNFITFSHLTSTSFNHLLPFASANSITTFLTNFGECDTLNTIYAKGTPHCSLIATFDTTIPDDPFNDPNFIAFSEKNTTLNASGTRTINPDSILAQFINYNNNRTSPYGTIDGSILNSLQNKTSYSFTSDIISMIKSFLNSSITERRIASGAAFVNSSQNPDWQTYKYAQTYVSLARAISAFRKFSNDTTAFNNIPFFEGSKNPVIAFLESKSTLAISP